MENEERSHTPPPRMDSPEDNLTPQLKVKVNGMKFNDEDLGCSILCCVIVGTINVFIRVIQWIIYVTR